MSSYTFKSTLSDVTLFRVCATGSKIYFLAGLEIYEYDPAGAGTETKIITSANYDARDMVCFGDNVYFGHSESGTGDYIVARWDGTVDNATDVVTIASAPGANSNFTLYSNDAYIAAVARSQADDAVYAKHSADGSSWSNSTITSEWAADLGFTDTELNQFDSETPPVDAFCKDAEETSPRDCLQNHMLSFTAGVWSELVADPDHPSYGGNSGVYFTSEASPLYTEDFVSFGTPGNGDVNFIKTIGVPFTLGYFNDSVDSNTKFYKWGGANWISMDDTASEEFLGNIWAARMDDGSVYLVLDNIYTGNQEVWERADPIKERWALTHTASGIPGSILV